MGPPSVPDLHGPLKSGGYILIDHTEALIFIDVARLLHGPATEPDHPRPSSGAPPRLGTHKPMEPGRLQKRGGRDAARVVLDRSAACGAAERRKLGGLAG